MSRLVASSIQQSCSGSCAADKVQNRTLALMLSMAVEEDRTTEGTPAKGTLAEASRNRSMRWQALQRWPKGTRAAVGVRAAPGSSCDKGGEGVRESVAGERGRLRRSVLGAGGEQVPVLSVWAGRRRGLVARERKKGDLD
jgi:hypothetical protein